MRYRHGVIGMVCAIALAACGGGGGGGGGGSGGGGGGGGGGGTPPASDAPTFQFSATYPDSNWPSLADETAQRGGALLSYGQFATDLVHRFAIFEATTPVTVNCAYAGRVTLQVTDRDGNGRASVGDAITAVLENCGMPVLGRAATGTVRVDIVAASAQGVQVEHQAQLTVVDALQLTAIPGGPNLGLIDPGTLRGSLVSRWSGSSLGQQWRVTSSTADDLSLSTSFRGAESLLRFRQIDVASAVQYDLATSTGSMAFVYDVGARGGTLRVSTPVPMHGDLAVAPRQMQIDIAIAGDRVMRLQARKANTGPEIGLGFATAPGPSNYPERTIWPLDLMRFVGTLDGGSGGATYTDQGSGSKLVASWRDAAISSDIDRACQQGAVSQTFFKADALFQRPVVAPKALSEAGAVVALRFGRALADNTPTLQFRFTDTEFNGDDRYPNWSVPATALRQGASFEIRPSEPLRRGHLYVLEASTNGVDWSTPKTFVDAQGAIVSSGGASLGSYLGDFSLRARVTFGDTATVSALSPARLKGEATLQAGQTVAGYQWQQISGPAVTLSSPQGLETDVLVGALPQDVGEAVLQLTITDSRGASDRARVVVSVGNRVVSGAALYRVTGRVDVSARRELVRGSGSVFYGPAGGETSPRVLGPTEGGTGVPFSVRRADGGRLQVGLYASATTDFTSTTLPGLRSGVFCETQGDTASGSFEVLDVAYADDGTLTRLALDYEQRCNQGGEFQRGSYRLNSTSVLRP